ncbi:MAG: HopJ type III effector protein [Bacteroidota bacterium]
MNTTLTNLLNDLKSATVSFAAVIAQIEKEYTHQPTAFKNGDVYNEANENQGSAKVFAYAKLHNLSEAETLLLFAEHYQAVLADPKGTNHQNIRQFMQHGWAGISFEGKPLS